MVDDDGAVGASGAKAAKIGAVHHDLEHSTGQRLVVAGSNLLDHDFRVGVVDEGQGVDTDIIIESIDSDRLIVHIGDQVPTRGFRFNEFPCSSRHSVPVCTSVIESTVRTSGHTINLCPIEVDIKHGARKAIARLIYLLNDNCVFRLVLENDRTAGIGLLNTIAIFIFQPQTKVLRLLRHLIARRRDDFGHSVLTWLDIVLASRVFPLEFQCPSLITGDVHIDGIRGQLLEVEGGRANAVAVRINLLNYSRRRLRLSVLDCHAAIDRRGRLLGRIIGRANSNCVASTIGNIVRWSGDFLEIEGLGG